MNINSIVNEIRKYNTFDLNIYYNLIRKYGKILCKEAFDIVFQKSHHKNNTFNKYFDAFFSFKLDEMEINEDSYLILAQKYGEDTIKNYFERLLLVKNINTKLILI